MRKNKQIAANKLNAIKGGVKTDQGKAVSSKNALTHGVLAQQVLVGEQDHYSGLVAMLMEDYEPRTVIQKVLVERMALIVVQLNRLNWASNEFWQSCLEPELRGPDPLAAFGVGKLISPGYEPKISPDKIEHLLSLYHRYQTRLENQLIKMDRVFN